MSAIRLGSAVNVRAFQALVSAVASSEGAPAFDLEALQDEFGRFRVWSGNLGALQKGHSSLDYRLRDSPLLLSNVLRLLQELQGNLEAAQDVISGVRLPYEQQPKPDPTEQDEEDDDFFSEDEDEDSDAGAPKTELEMRFREIVDIIDHLYKLSVRIRGARSLFGSRSLKAALYQPPKDPDTGINVLDQYAALDLQHTKELVRQLRLSLGQTVSSEEEPHPLILRLAHAVTLRRRQFMYWRRHRDKLGISTVIEEPLPQPTTERPDALQRHDTTEAQLGEPSPLLFREAPSQKTGKTLLSGTEATHHIQSLDDIVDSKSVTSYATTVRDLTGKGIDLPPPPRAADGDKDFECPYCFIMCPARYGKGRSWRTHLLQDLQPYICTYPECPTPDQLFRSRREWSEHEASHRKAWRCPEHPTAVYKTEAGLRDHFEQNHGDLFPISQLDSIVKVGETSTVDLRPSCPICHAPADLEDMGGFQNHIANHLERIAAFALPKDIDDDSQGNSQEASRGRSDSTRSQDLSGMSFASYDDEPQEDEEASTAMAATTDSQVPASADISSGLGPEQPGRGLSESLVRELGDASSKRLDILLSDNDYPDDSTPPETQAEVEEHMAEMEEFRTYLMSFTGAQSVRFYRRYGSWLGRVDFDNEASASAALGQYDAGRYPDAWVSVHTKNKAALRFSLQRAEKVSGTEVQSPSFDVDDDSTDSDNTSGSELYVADKTHEPLLAIEGIPTLRSLYRSGKLVHGDQSTVANDAYNQIISFCFHDIRRLTVDAIVNSANRDLKVNGSGWTLNHLVHKAAGRDLRKECKGIRRLKFGQAAVTAGYKLPSPHVIHAVRPHYRGGQGVGQYNQLAECYKNSLRLAMSHGFKTIAFPCLGAGGCGFLPRVAARVALQEVREYLDTHEGHGFERIVFCVYDKTDEQAYLTFFPVFFPPTQADVEQSVRNEPRSSRATLSSELFDAHSQIAVVIEELFIFNKDTPQFPHRVIEAFVNIMNGMRSLQEVLSGPQVAIPTLAGKVPSDISLACKVMQTACGSITEIFELAKAKANLGQPSNQAIWDDYNFHMKTSQNLDILGLLELCQDMVRCLEDVVVRKSAVPYEMGTISVRLGSWLLKLTGKGQQYVRDRFDEVMYVREFQKDAALPPRTGVIKLHQIPSIARMYQIGELAPRETDAKPTMRFNHTICLLREDITRLEVDVMVNSTDSRFSGMGTLDRAVFQKGGLDMKEDCASFGPCKEGDVRLTGGYGLPAKHVLHAVPPEVYRTNSLNVLSKIYRDILNTAASLSATSLAIPAIGTGMLSYPRRDTTMVAISEVKKFLESTESSMSIEKIIFVVYGSSDELTYKSLIPIYFPPLDTNTNKALPSSGSGPSGKPLVTSAASPGGPYPPPRRTLFGTISEAIRSVTFGKQPATHPRRPLHSGEDHALLSFETHAQGCQICGNIQKVYAQGEELCADGYAAAQLVLQYVYMEADESIYSTNLTNNKRVRVSVPMEYARCWELLATVEKSFRDTGNNRDRPFVSPNQPWRGIASQTKGSVPGPTDFTIVTDDASISREPEKAIAFAFTWSNEEKDWRHVQPYACSIHIYPGKVSVFETEHQYQTQVPLLSLELTPLVPMEKHISTEVIIDHARTLQESVIKTSSQVMLRCRSPAECEMLFQRLKHAAKTNPTYMAHRSVQEQTGSRLSSIIELMELPSVPTHEPMNAGGEAWAQTKARLAEDLRSGRNIEVSPTNYPKSPLPYLFGNRVVAHLKSLPRPYEGLHQDRIAGDLGVHVGDVARVVEHLQALDLIHPVFGKTDTWAASRVHDAEPSLPQQRPYREPQDPTRDEDFQLFDSGPESAPNLSPQLPPNDDVDALLGKLVPTLSLVQRTPPEIPVDAVRGVSAPPSPVIQPREEHIEEPKEAASIQHMSGVDIAAATAGQPSSGAARTASASDDSPTLGPLHRTGSPQGLPSIPSSPSVAGSTGNWF